MRARQLHHLPITDKSGRVTGIFTEESLISDQPLPNTTVLMVGGYGKRLGEMTRNCPKPMLRIGGKPILQTIVELLRDAGLRDFVFTINYLSEHITSHFGDGRDFGVSIEYFEEDEPLGTAGALGRVKLRGEDPLLVMNGDILTRMNFGHLLHYHSESNASATMCVRQMDQQIHFGVVELDGAEILGLKEKPTSRYFINSGIYVVEQSALRALSSSGRSDMPDLFAKLREDGEKTIAYPIQEYWRDVGRLEDFEQAEEDYDTFFPIPIPPSRSSVNRGNK
jgi:NDP-sugar pyrophosphorylase family protein